MAQSWDILNFIIGRSSIGKIILVFGLIKIKK